ncbi:unnamed protein product [Psylliodes chrysocephalus]|uniref:Uncharacterized protein n=1 Tax=Psylliodes chrysocephalus TaxID=3402493 RepID=A0A9P0CJ14_9CUCU|nr:unnamed protein product [Psylliodes chrysocephala]
MSEKWISRIIGSNIGPYFFKGTKNHFFTLRFYKRNYCVIPIVMLAVCDMCWVTFCTVQCFIRTNIVATRWDRRDRDKLELLIQPKNRKFLTINQTYPVQQDLYETYRDMMCEEERRRGECNERESKCKEKPE